MMQAPTCFSSFLYQRVKLQFEDHLHACAVYRFISPVRAESRFESKDDANSGAIVFNCDRPFLSFYVGLSPST